MRHKRTAITLVLAAVVFVLLAVALSYRAATNPGPPFSVGNRKVEVKVRPSLSIGLKFAVMVAPDGTLWGWGNRGEAGFLANSWKPEKVNNDTDWKQVAAGFRGFLALKQDGSLWAMGMNAEGLLSLPGAQTGLSPLSRVGNDSDWKELRAGVAHCLALKTDGSLWAWGKNSYGQVGVGKITPVEPITRIGTDTNWIAISAGDMSSYGLKSDGTLWGWGSGVFGPGTTTAPMQMDDRATWRSVSAGAYHIVAMDRDGSAWIRGPNTRLIDRDAPAPTTNWFKLNIPPDTVEIISGSDCIIGRRANGAWARTGRENLVGARSWPLPKMEPLAIELKHGTTLLLMPDGRLWSYENRIGAVGQFSIWRRTMDRIESLLGNGAMAGLPPLVDAEPVLLWEQP